MHPPEVRQEATELIRLGLNDCEVARRLGLPRTTVRGWRRPDYAKQARGGWAPCPRCWRDVRPLSFTDDDYAEILGLYLGDGTITKHPRTQKLRVHFDAKYPRLIVDCEELLRRSFPGASLGRVIADRGSTVIVYLYDSHLACLFPQHGPGKKHERAIHLEPWQQALVGRAPWSFLRGLIRSDGCVFTNRTGRYEYVSYDFCNYSQDILHLFTQTCDTVGVEYRRHATRVRINRRASVAKMLEHVGRKS